VSLFLLILSSPSGGGKTTIARMLLRERPDLGYSVSATTRGQRRGERDRVDYYFLSEQEFQRRIDRGAFLEWAQYGVHLYGTLEEEVNRILGRGHHVLLDIEVDGARQVRQRRQDVVSIFILPPSAEVLLQRLRGRKREDEVLIRKRVLRAVEELGEAVQYDYVVVNDDLSQTVAEVSAIIDAETRSVPRLTDLRDRIAKLQAGLQRVAAARAPE
jgi:guanylate kinase